MAYKITVVDYWGFIISGDSPRSENYSVNEWTNLDEDESLA